MGFDQNSLKGLLELTALPIKLFSQVLEHFSKLGPIPFFCSLPTPFILLPPKVKSKGYKNFEL